MNESGRSNGAVCVGRCRGIASCLALLTKYSKGHVSAPTWNLQLCTSQNKLKDLEFVGTYQNDAKRWSVSALNTVKTLLPGCCTAFQGGRDIILITTTEMEKTQWSWVRRRQKHETKNVSKKAGPKVECDP